MGREIQTGLNVKELIELLQDHDPLTPVFFSYGYGDRARTDVAEPVESAEELEVQWSPYHDRCKLAQDVNGEGETLTVLVLR